MRRGVSGVCTDPPRAAPRADAASCTNLPDLSTLTNNGPASDQYQGTSPAPTGAQCVQEATTGGYFCGIQGAACSSDSNCDNGSCQNGQWRAGLDVPP